MVQTLIFVDEKSSFFIPFNLHITYINVNETQFRHKAERNAAKKSFQWILKEKREKLLSVMTCLQWKLDGYADVRSES